MKIKNKIRECLIRIISSRNRLKYNYLRFATFLSTRGIPPPFVPTVVNAVKRWEKQGLEGEGIPAAYLREDNSIFELFKDILPYLENDDPLLEIGCNAGRSLNYLYAKGYKNLTGIEIGQQAIEEMKKHFPCAYNHCRIFIGNAPSIIRNFKEGEFSLVFCHSVLVNIHPDQNKIFKEIARVSNKFILILENEGSYLAFPRDFKNIFERYGFKMILSKVFRGGCTSFPIPFKDDDYYNNNTIRLFVKKL